MTMNGAELYWEPELEAGSVTDLLERGGRVLDLGELDPSYCVPSFFVFHR